MGVGRSEREGAENCGSLRREREQERRQVERRGEREEGGMKRLKDNNRKPGRERGMKREKRFIVHLKTHPSSL